MRSLKQCPFCGGPAYDKEAHESLVWVECRECGAKTDDRIKMEECDELWNRRNNRGSGEMSRLKPCPFCGGPACYQESHEFWVWVECRECGAKTDDRIKLEECHELWNRREAAGVEQ